MCIPVAALAVASLAVGAAGVGLQAYGQYQSGKAAQQQAQINSAQAAMQAQLAGHNASEILRYGKLNSEMTLALNGLNTSLTQGVADINVGLINASTDFNVASIGAVSDFNTAVAEGAASLIEARGRAQQMVHDQNAQVLEVQASDTLEAGNQAQRQSRLGYAGLKGQQRARLAANGVTLDEGSSLRIQSDTDYMSDVDAETIRVNAIKTAMGYRVNAINEVTQGKFAALDARAQALQVRASAAADRVQASAAIAKARVEGGLRGLDTKLTASHRILQSTLGANVDALNLRRQSEQEAWNARASAVGYQGRSALYAHQASSINPGLMAGTSLLNGAAQLAGQWYNYSQAGVFK